MLSDDKYYGIYRGLVADNNDPDDLGRVKLVIPQVLGQAVTTWAWPVGGNITQSKWPYGTFIKSSSQTVSGANAATVVTGWAEDDVNKTRVSGTKLYAEETGDYLFQFSTVFTKSGGSLTTADIWLRKNGSNVANTNTRVTITGNNAETVITVPFILDLDAEDYIELVFSSPNNSTTLTGFGASTSPTRPAMPAIIATLHLVGKWKPQPNTGVWVMFEGGDPHFPVWFGGF